MQELLRSLLALLLLAGSWLIPATGRAEAQGDSASEVVRGRVKSVVRELNVPGARCGYHYEITIAREGAPNAVIFIYDMRVPYEALSRLEGKQVEASVYAKQIARSISVVGEPADARLAGFVSQRHC